MDKIGKRLKKLREESNLTQGQVAGYLGVDQSFVSKVEKDERDINVSQLEDLLKLYGSDLGMFNNNETVEPLNIAFRASCLDNEDLKAIADVRKIINNSKLMERILNENNK